MSRGHGQLAALIPHPSQLPRAVAVRSLSASVGALPPGRLVFEYRLEGDLARLRLPPAGAAQRLDGLWKHTCFEAFVAVTGTKAYTELNFSPSGDWSAYEFTDYRQGMAHVQLQVPPQIAVRQGKNRLQLAAMVALPASEPREVLRVGLTAVVQAEDGSLSYWATKHAPGKKPDFHHPEGLTLEVTP